ncbi:energy-coupling factor transporter transmembrane protein EcfT [uncultured Adlercreutzia sp.]|uniref:energy-coupling factor transporter transmembrane component T family protein n=1 Tax=uncultured Adlercreutzia sp. TaxID=875803 RepID=UPI002676E3AF|nr:energy-coupling factor transporter transmembrane component T [uncultured Adlercreutzia sp.]
MTVLGGQSTRIAPAVRRLDGRVKIALLVAYSVMLFLVEDLVGLGVAAVLLVVAMVAGRVRGASVLRAGMPAVVIAAFLLLYNGVSSGWATGVAVAARVMLLVYASAALMELSTPTELSEALRRLLAPLGRAGLPVRDATCALSIALRFIPVTAEELASVRAAQASRGAALGTGSAGARLRANAGLMAPLFVGLFRRADRLAAAMDARCYGASGEPTSLDGRRFSLGDGVILVVGCGLCLGAALLF